MQIPSIVTQALNERLMDKFFKEKDVSSEIDRAHPFFKALLSGNLQEVEKCLKLTSSLPVLTSFGWGILRVAAKLGIVSIVKLLNNSNKIYNAKIVQYEALMEAAASGNLEVVQYFIGEKINEKTVKNAKGTPLIEAIKRGHFEIVKFLMPYSNVKAIDSYGATPLMFAIVNRQDEIALYLIPHSDVNAVDTLNRNSLVYTIISGIDPIFAVNQIIFRKDTATTKRIDHKSSVENKKRSLQQLKNFNKDNGRDTSMHESTHEIEHEKKASQETGQVVALEKPEQTKIKRPVTVIQALIQHKVDVNWVDDTNRTALIFAAINNQCEVAEILLQNGAAQMIDCVGMDGATALHRAIHFGFVEMVQLLLNHGANVKLPVENKSAARKIPMLMLAVLSNEPRIVQLLMNYKVNMDEVDDFGRTALMSAILSYEVDIALMLVRNGCDVDVQDRSGDVALQMAFRLCDENFDKWKILINEIIDHSKDRINQETINFAICMGNVEIFKKLYNLRDKDCDDVWLLECAIFSDKIEMCEFLVAQKVDVNGTAPLTAADQEFIGTTSITWKRPDNEVRVLPIIAAASGNNLILIKLLLRVGAVVNVSSSDGMNPLSINVINGDIDSLKLFIEAFLNHAKDHPEQIKELKEKLLLGIAEAINIQDVQKLQLLMDAELILTPQGESQVLENVYVAACKNNIKKILHFLFSSEKSKAHILSFHFANSLYYALESRNKELLGNLLECLNRGSNIQIRGVSILKIAISKFPDMVEAVLNLRADPELLGPDNQTALNFALENSSFHAAALLLEKKLMVGLADFFMKDVEKDFRSAFKKILKVFCTHVCQNFNAEIHIDEMNKGLYLHFDNVEYFYTFAMLTEALKRMYAAEKNHITYNLNKVEGYLLELYAEQNSTSDIDFQDIKIVREILNDVLPENVEFLFNHKTTWGQDVDDFSHQVNDEVSKLKEELQKLKAFLSSPTSLAKLDKANSRKFLEQYEKSEKKLDEVCEKILTSEESILNCKVEYIKKCAVYEKQLRAKLSTKATEDARAIKLQFKQDEALLGWLNAFKAAIKSLDGLNETLSTIRQEIEAAQNRDAQMEATYLKSKNRDSKHISKAVTSASADKVDSKEIEETLRQQKQAEINRSTRREALNQKKQEQIDWHKNRQAELKQAKDRTNSDKKISSEQSVCKSRVVRKGPSRTYRQFNLNIVGGFNLRASLKDEIVVIKGIESFSKTIENYPPERHCSLLLMTNNAFLGLSARVMEIILTGSEVPPFTHAVAAKFRDFLYHAPIKYIDSWQHESVKSMIVNMMNYLDTYLKGDRQGGKMALEAVQSNPCFQEIMKFDLSKEPLDIKSCIKEWKADKSDIEWYDRLSNDVPELILDHAQKFSVGRCGAWAAQIKKLSPNWNTALQALYEGDGRPYESTQQIIALGIITRHVKTGPFVANNAILSSIQSNSNNWKQKIGQGAPSTISMTPMYTQHQVLQTVMIQRKDIGDSKAVDRKSGQQ